MNKAYKYRLYPNKEQALLINKTFGCVRFVYNQMLTNRKAVYEQYKDDKEALKQQKHALPADYKKEFPWLKEVGLDYSSKTLFVDSETNSPGR